MMATRVIGGLDEKVELAHRHDNNAFDCRIRQGPGARRHTMLHLALSAFIDPRSSEPFASELRELSSGASPDASGHAPLTPQIELNDAPIMELHSTRVQGSTCKHAAIPTGLSRRCDWVVMNETSEGLIKYRSPPRCVSSPMFS